MPLPLGPLFFFLFVYSHWRLSLNILWFLLTDTNKSLCIYQKSNWDLCGSGISSRGILLEYLVESKLPGNLQCQNAMIFCVGLICFFSRKSSAVLIWGLDDIMLLKEWERRKSSVIIDFWLMHLFLASLFPPTLNIPGVSNCQVALGFGRVCQCIFLSYRDLFSSSHYYLYILSHYNSLSFCGKFKHFLKCWYAWI